MSAAAESPVADSVSAPVIAFKVTFNKVLYALEMSSSSTIGDLKTTLQDLTGCPSAMQKLTYKGLLKDDSKSLASVGISSGTKFMGFGSSVNDLMKISAASASGARASASSSSGGGALESVANDKWCEKTEHKKVLDKGIPDDVMAGKASGQEALPLTPLTGLVNRVHQKVRLSVKLETDELCISTKDRTQKFPLGQVRAITSQPIESHAGYVILAIQVGPTEASRYFVYWFPAQYVSAFRRSVMN